MNARPYLLASHIARQKELVQALLDASKRDVRIRILLNDNLFADSLPAIQQAFAGIRNVEVAGLMINPLRRLGVMHAKALIVDGEIAFLAGLPFAQGYWDTQLHCVTDPRRGSGAGGNFPPLGDVGNGVGKKPAHTVSLGMGGPAATDVDKTFISLWNSVSTDTLPPPIIIPGSGSQSIQIVRSSPALNANGLSQGEKGILESHLRAINNAREFIYLEAQYFTSPVIVAALMRALQTHPDLQLILLLNENPDFPTYKFWQNTFLPQLASFPGRVGVFALWRTQPPTNEQQKVEIMQCYMEAKVSLVDDVWASVDSGNLDGASLGHIFEFLPSPLSCTSASKGWRNFEINAVLYDGIADQPETGAVSQLRTLLWREHLGLEDIPEGPPAGGWLALWNTIAHQNIVSLNTTQSMSGNPASPSRILPYAQALDTVGQLSQLGVNVDLFDVAP